MMGCGQPAGEQGFNVARVVAVLAGLDDVPGVTVNRYCSSSLQTIRMAAHAIKAGEGDVFIAAGVECVSRYGAGASDTAPNPVFADAGLADEGSAPRAASRRGRRPRGCPTSTSPWARRPRTSVSSRASAGGRWTSSPRSPSSGRWPASRTASSSGRSCPLTLPDGTVVRTDDGPRPGTTVEKLAELKPVFRPDGEITAGNACPLNDGAAAVIVMSDTKAERAGHHARWPASSPAGSPA